MFFLIDLLYNLMKLFHSVLTDLSLLCLQHKAPLKNAQVIQNVV